MSEYIIKIVEYLEEDSFTGSTANNKLKALLDESLSTHNDLVVDFLNVKSLSPSFAYEHFGKLVDKYGSHVLSKIKFVNDPLDLGKRVVDAIQRRIRVVAA